MCKPRKHAAIIKAWADGAEIEFRCPGLNWAQCRTPSWDTSLEYRVKPEKKPDVVIQRPIRLVRGTIQGRNENRYYGNNCQFTFDGETGKLKKVELI